MSLWVVRKWDGDEWPDKRLSIANKDTQEALFISPRYANIDSEEVKECFDMAAAAPDMYEALEYLREFVPTEHDRAYIDLNLAKARGEK